MYRQGISVNIAIDWNSTLQDQIGEICHRTCLVPADFTQWDPQLGHRCGMTETAFTKWAWTDESIQAMAEPYPGAAEGVCRLSSWATIWVVTSTSCPMLVQPWLRRWGIPFDKVIVTQDKASVPWDLLIDDNPSTLVKLAAEGRQVLRHRLPWNEYLVDVEGVQWLPILS